MNVFELRKRLVGECRLHAIIHPFRGDRIRDLVEKELESGLLWPDPIIRLNPAFGPGEWIEELVNRGVLHEDRRRIFRIKTDRHDDVRPLRLHGPHAR